MDIEQAYIKYDNAEKIIAIVKQRLSGKFPDIVIAKELADYDSYDTMLADNPKRKVAVSVSKNGWITIIESKEVNDNALLLYISKELNTDVLAVVQSDITGVWGFAEMSKGVIIRSYFSDEDDEIEDLVISKLKEHFIETSLYMFREIVKNAEWNIIYM